MKVLAWVILIGFLSLVIHVMPGTILQNVLHIVCCIAGSLVVTWATYMVFFGE